jgi:hypothetical protein
MFKKNLLLVISSTLIAFSSCRKNDPVENVAPVQQDNLQVCIQNEKHNSQRTNGAVLGSNKWVNGQTISIKFLNGDTFLQNKVKTYAEIWTNYANLKFQWVSTAENADIKISFNATTKSNSAVGTDCKYFDQNSHSMDLGLIGNTNESIFSSVVLHEFGHALGMIHEHQSPKSNFMWNKPYVYSVYMNPPYNLSAAEVDFNIFYKYSEASTNSSSTAFDPASIMCYSFPSNYTTNGYSTPVNYRLSPTDIRFISKEYPGVAIALLYRCYTNGKHLYTSNPTEAANNGFEGVMGGLSRTQKFGTIPLYRYFNYTNGGRLTTTNYGELGGGGSGGWKYEGIHGYVYPTSIYGTLQVGRYFNGGSNDHFYTTSQTELGAGGNGWTFEGIGFNLMKQ